MGFKSHIKEFVRPLANLVWASEAYARVLFRLDALTQSISRIERKKIQGEKYTVLLSPAGEGNIGDHAMLNAYLEMTQGPLVVLSAGSGPEVSGLSQLPGQNGREIRVISARSIYTLPPILRVLDVFRFSRLLRNADAFHIHGADTMDGSQIACSLARLSLCNLARRDGVPTEILGFSWRENPPAIVAKSIVDLSHSMVLKPRDPLSARRLINSGAHNVKPVADMAFSLSRKMSPPQYVLSWMSDTKIRGSQFMVLNVSGLVAKKLDQVSEIGQVIAEAHRNDMKILFLPHVIRDGDDDLLAVSECYDKYGSETDLCVTDLMTPEQIRFITSEAVVTVTGRMHLSILSLSTGTPAIALDTAGKVEGLFELFGMQRFVVRVRPGFGRAIINCVSVALRNDVPLRKQIEVNLGLVRTASGENFKDLKSARVDHCSTKEHMCAD